MKQRGSKCQTKACSRTAVSRGMCPGCYYVLVRGPKERAAYRARVAKDIL